MAALRRMLIASSLVLLLLAVPYAVRAQDAKEETTIHVGTPEHVQLGDRVTVQAVLADSAGQPISDVMVYFSVQSKFLTASGYMEVAQARTNENGQAVAEFDNGLQGKLTVRAEFRGDDHYAASDASTEMNVEGQAQLYVPQVGVQIPGLNQPPPPRMVASLSRPTLGTIPDVPNLWPSMSGWPIALVLAIIWGLYVFVVVLIFRIAAPTRGNHGYNVETGRFE